MMSTGSSSYVCASRLPLIKPVRGVFCACVTHGSLPGTKKSSQSTTRLTSTGFPNKGPSRTVGTPFPACIPAILPMFTSQGGIVHHRDIEAFVKGNELRIPRRLVGFCLCNRDLYLFDHRSRAACSPELSAAGVRRCCLLLGFSTRNTAIRAVLRFL